MAAACIVLTSCSDRSKANSDDDAQEEQQPDATQEEQQPDAAQCALKMMEIESAIQEAYAKGDTKRVEELGKEYQEISAVVQSQKDNPAFVETYLMVMTTAQTSPDAARMAEIKFKLDALQKEIDEKCKDENFRKEYEAALMESMQAKEEAEMQKAFGK